MPVGQFFSRSSRTSEHSERDPGSIRRGGNYWVHGSTAFFNDESLWLWVPAQGRDDVESFAIRISRNGCDSAFSRRNTPEVCETFRPSWRRGRRESRAPTAPVDPVRRSTRASRVPKHTGANYRYSRDIPAFPTQWVYGLLRALPGDRALLPPSSRGSLRQT